MSNPRIFSFPISLLLRDAKLLHTALTETGIGAGVLGRLTNDKNLQPAQTLDAQILLVETGGTQQSGATGDLTQLTQAQALAFTELEHLTSAARRSAGHVFAAGDPRLHSEFQVGIHDPQDLASELERAKKIHAAVGKYAAEIGTQGWIAADTTALGTAIDTLSGADEVQESAKGKKKGVTAGRNTAANVLYKQCLAVQNAARLAYPETKGNEPAVVEGRARFLLDTFPPRNDTPPTATPPAPTPPPAN